MYPPQAPHGRVTFPVLLVAWLAACSSSSDDDSSFVLLTTTQAAEPTAPIVLSGSWMVYFASEAASGMGGTVLNGDGLKDDQVAFAVDLATGLETNLGVAARGAVILGSEIYLKVAESEDGFDWDPMVADAVVLLHWSAATGMVVRVDTLDPVPAAEMPVVAGGSLFYAAAPMAPLAGDETNLRRIAAAAPTIPIEIENVLTGGPVAAHLLGQRNGLLFASVDETVDGVPRNGDGLADDAHVLALLDGTLAGARLVCTELALASASEPLAARVLGANDWLAAFLVDEAAQGSSLNDQTDFPHPLLPDDCAAVVDTDTDDRVLHYLRFAAFPGTAPVNTGLVGQDRVLVFDGFVATISDEDHANCNLNIATGDTDEVDFVARWVATTLPNQPEVDRDLMHALATTTAGGSMGLAVLDDRLVAVIDEAQDGTADFDAQPGEIAVDRRLIAWLDPAATLPEWEFAHQGTDRSVGTGVFDSQDDSEPFAATSWMAPEAVGGRLGLVYLEEAVDTNPNIGPLNTNLDCNLVVKDSDKTDGLPVWADFGAGPTLDFDGMGYAVDKANAGIEIAGGFAFFRVSENNDNRDYNNDQMKDDAVVFVNPLTRCSPVPLATSSFLPGQVITTDRALAAAFLSDEVQAGLDFNADGDEMDKVVRYFSF